MRRKDKESSDPQVFEEIMASAEVGYLAIVLDDGNPRAVPLNFVLHEGKIFFHGARAGEKFDVFTNSPGVSFTAAMALSIIPSYWFGEDACPATHLYKSATIYGRGFIVEEMEEKIGALTALMNKYQPEGNFKAFDANDPLYEKSLARTAVFKIEPTEITIKVNVAQNEDDKTKRRMIEGLTERNHGTDRVTAEEIRQTLSEPAKE